jgi:hypothetical protein
VLAGADRTPVGGNWVCGLAGGWVGALGWVGGWVDWSSCYSMPPAPCILTSLPAVLTSTFPCPAQPPPPRRRVA